MHILFEALDRKKGMSFSELVQNVEKAAKLASLEDDKLANQSPKFLLNFNGTVKSFEIEA